MNRLLIYISLIFTVSIAIGCKSDYTRYVEREMATDVKNDSLIFTLELGMNQKEYFDSCWQLNRRQIIAQGDGSGNARYIIRPDSTAADQSKAMEMLFKGVFDNNKIMRGMDFDYSYTGWATWNEHLQSDSLLLSLKNTISADYGGNPWLEVKMEDLGVTSYVKIDGNRQFLIFPVDQRTVKVKIADLDHKEFKK